MLLGNCTTATRSISEQLDRSLTRAQRVRLRVHLLACRGCRAYASQLATLRLATRIVSGQSDVGATSASDSTPD
ncbi:zf-HC2 domain-containing protein [Pandoraea sp. ISTKB]|uniref:zf-HC2 domain-containing protein n=1 Tax=Pandoraea sp. ISTKB TaxID=1586708 RepID=UPI0009F61544|nr:zf-HC2 domain-containing protein [Pandoraea sp. ISTKB]